MPTPQQMLVIQQIQQLAQSIRGASQQATEGQQIATTRDFQNQQLGQQIQSRADLARQQQEFQAGESAKDRSLSVSEGVKRRESQEKIAGMRSGVRDKVTINLMNTDKDFGNTEVNSGGFVPVTDAKGNVIDVQVNPEVAVRADSQGKAVRSHANTIEKVPPEMFQNPEWRDNWNKSVTNKIAKLKDSGFSDEDGPIVSAEILRIQPQETKQQFRKRLQGYWKNLVMREFSRRTAPEPRVSLPPGSEAGFGSLVRQPTPMSAKEKAKIRKEIIQEFGGDFIIAPSSPGKLGK